VGELRNGSEHHQFKVQCVFGGREIKKDISKMQRSVPDLLIATPGRLNDLLENHGWGAKLSAIQTLVLDEADQLLDLGFRPAIEALLRRLPPPTKRQTLLFSATMPKNVQTIAQVALRDSYTTVDCCVRVGNGNAENAADDVHREVLQQYTVCPMDSMLGQLHAMLVEAMQMNKQTQTQTKTKTKTQKYHTDSNSDSNCDIAFKIVVFFATARQTQLHAEIFSIVFADHDVAVHEMHSRKSQPERTKTSKLFRVCV
jgi:ATP-dependent RNA helicase MSS116